MPKFIRRIAIGKCVTLLAVGMAASVFSVMPCKAQGHDLPGAVTFRCGGIGVDDLQQMKLHAHDFNLGFWMVEGPRGAYLADVPIQIDRDGKIVASFVASGPLCYLKAPAGAYTIIGIHHGQTRKVDAHTGNFNVYLRW